MLVLFAIQNTHIVNNATQLIVHSASMDTFWRTTLVTLVQADSQDAIFVILLHVSLVMQDTSWKMQHVILAHRDSQTQ